MAFGEPGTGLGFASDQQVPTGVYRWSSRWARTQRDAVVREFSHVLIESGRAPFGDASGVSPRRQLESLSAAGLTVGLVFHGSDIRMPSAHRRRVELSPFGGGSVGGDWDLVPLLELRSRENAALAARLGAPAFVTTPDLLRDLPEASWLPVVVDPAPWLADGRQEALTRSRPVVVHAPTRGRLKGSAFIDPVLTRLDDDGLITYRRVSGIPSAQMPEVYASADIVVDQILLGDYGVSAIEAMLAGRLVLGHVSDHSRRVIREALGVEVPVLDAVPETIEQTIRAVVADPQDYRGLIEAGSRYARLVHGGGYSADVLRDFLGR
jgi:hypothetical protein